MGTSKGKKAQGRHGNLPEAPFPLGPLGENKRFRERKPEECIEEAGEAPRGSSGPWQLQQGDYNSSEKDTHRRHSSHPREKTGSMATRAGKSLAWGQGNEEDIPVTQAEIPKGREAAQPQPDSSSQLHHAFQTFTYMHVTTGKMAIPSAGSASPPYSPHPFHTSLGGANVDRAAGTEYKSNSFRDTSVPMWEL